MTLNTTVTTVDVADVLRQCLILRTGVTNGKEWTRVNIAGDFKDSKMRSMAFDYLLIQLCKDAGCRMYTSGSTTKDPKPEPQKA
jgi:hypothetical protein